LEAKEFKVVNQLADEDIDIIFHMSPFPFLSGNSVFSFFDAYRYKLKHPETIIVHQINDGDERKNTNIINQPLIKASKYSDYTVFIASWLKPLLIKQGFPADKPSRIILNGADEGIFNTKEKQLWNKKDKLKIVTHHWSGNYMKGHDIYQRLDKLLNEKTWSDRFEFTYIGSYPKNLTYNNTELIPPIAGEELASELKKNHIYLTASKNEPAGMHHIEGALCGLPVLYLNSGALPEYCQNYGLEFNDENFVEKLEEMRQKYDLFVDRLKQYNNTAERMAQEYYDLFIELYAKKEKLKIRGGKTARRANSYWIGLYGWCYTKGQYSKLFKIKIKNKIRGKINFIKSKNITFKKLTHYPIGKYYFWASYRQKMLDRLKNKYKYLLRGVVLDIGGRDRGKFKKPKTEVKKWIFSDIEKTHNPDVILDVAQMDTIADESIDTIFATELFEHVERINAGLTECYRVLKHNRYMIASVPFLHHIHNDPGDWQRWTEQKWKKELAAIGFEVESLEIMGRYFTALAETARALIVALPRPLFKILRYPIFPILNLLVKLDNTGLVQNNERLSSFHGGYFIVARKK
jgi:SAM-dependent methyltransferase